MINIVIAKYWTIPFAVVYTLGYMVAAFLATGFGGGTGVFLSPVIALYGVGWLLLLVAIYASNKPNLSTAWFLLPLMLHYVISLTSVIASWNGNLKGTVYVWNEQRSVVWLNLGIYFGGQAVLWVTFFFTRRTVHGSNMP